VKDLKAGFRWDPSMSRWVRDDRMIGFDAPVVIKPKSGAPYTVRAQTLCGADLICTEMDR
jgi:hypothetical protein